MVIIFAPEKGYQIVHIPLTSPPPAPVMRVSRSTAHSSHHLLSTRPIGPSSVRPSSSHRMGVPNATCIFGT
jgi:hypothetical protein